MTITLNDHTWLAKVLKSGAEDATSIPAGKSLKIEITPNGEELLDAMCPPGKVWSARIIVEISETDA